MFRPKPAAASDRARRQRPRGLRALGALAASVVVTATVLATAPAASAALTGAGTIDPTTKFPVLVEGTAANGDLLERYQFGEPTIDPGELASADAFDPNKRWGQAGGLLSRIARAGSSKPDDATPR